MPMSMLPLPDAEIWFVTGSQHLYGPETLRRVEANGREIAGARTFGDLGDHHEQDQAEGHRPH